MCPDWRENPQPSCIGTLTNRAPARSVLSINIIELSNGFFDGEGWFSGL